MDNNSNNPGQSRINNDLKTADEREGQYVKMFLKEAKEQASEIVVLAQNRANALVDESKETAKKEGERLITAAKIEIERQAIKQGIELSKENILRVIEFPPHHRQAGISILSYFSDIVKQKYPNVDVNVRIEQFDNKVRLVINSPSGFKEIIEKTLEEYGQVINGSIEPKDFFDNQIYILQLQNKFELVALELRMTKNLLETTEARSAERIESMEQEFSRLHTLIGNSLSQLGSAKNERTVIGPVEKLILQQSSKESLNMVIDNNVTNDISISGGNISQTQIGTSDSTLNAYVEALQLNNYSSEGERGLKQALAALGRGIETDQVLSQAQRQAALADLVSFTEEIKKPPNEQNHETKKLFWGRLTEVMKFSAALVTLAAAAAKLAGLS